MKIKFKVQTPKSKPIDTLSHVINDRIVSEKYDEVMVSVAYMTVAGVRLLLSGFFDSTPKKSKWLVGLDDYVTQPGAIDVVLGVPGAEVRVVSYSDLNYRFHPKVYIFQKKSEPVQGLTILGSSNLTSQALAGNGEANAILEMTDPADYLQAQDLWDALWEQGHSPEEQELIAYKKEYDLHNRRKPKSAVVKRPQAGMMILSSDEAELDPTKAKTCWIECGNNTAMGRELELKAEQGLFFGLNPTGEEPKLFSFLLSTGNATQLRMKFQGNHMWRLQLTSEVPEVVVGLRPRLKGGGLGRSPYVAVFERTDNESTFRLRFIDLSSMEFKKLVKRSVQLGAYGKTTARQYGWC